MKTYNWKAAGLLAVSLLLGTQAPGLSGNLAFAADADGAYIPQVVWNVNPADNAIVRQGRMLVPIREAAAMLQMGMYVTSDFKTMTMLSPEHRIVFSPGVGTAVVDGKVQAMDIAPVVVNGKMYVPFRFLAQTFGYPIGNRDSTATISFKNRYVRGQLATETYWMDKTTGELYYSNGSHLPLHVGKLNMRIVDLGGGGFDVEKIGSRTIKLTMTDSYGEPHLHDVVYQALLLDNRLLIQSKVDYIGILGHDNVKTYMGRPVMIDGSVAKLADPDTGKVLRTFDMAALTGGKPGDSYVLEYISEDILLIRPYGTSLLTAVNLQTGQATMLYKKLLTEDWQKMLESWPPGGDYPGDQLRFVKRTGNTFELEWTDRMNGGQTTIYKWNDADV